MQKLKSKDQIKAEDVLAWATEELHRNLTNVILNMQNHPRPYFMLIHIHDGYDGKLGGLGHKVRNDLLNSKDQITPKDITAGERTIDLSKKKTTHNIIMLLDYPPAIPLLSTSLLKVDNRRGRVDWIYILPPDKPVIWGADMGEQSQFVFQSAKKSNAPVIFSN